MPRIAADQSSVGQLLITRMKEREESVRIEIMAVYGALLRQTKLTLPQQVEGGFGNWGFWLFEGFGC